MGIEIKHAKIGKYILIDGEPCKVSSMQTSSPGKHGHLKVRLVGVGVFDGKKREIMKPGNAIVEVPMIEKKSAQIISFSGDHIQVMDLTSYDTFDAHIPDELKGKLTEGDEVLYWEISGKKMIVSKK